MAQKNLRLAAILPQKKIVVEFKANLPISSKILLVGSDVKFKFAEFRMIKFDYFQIQI